MNDSNWQVISAVASAISAIGILAAFIALVLARNQLREAKKARMAEMTVELSRRWDDDRILEARMRISSFGDADALLRRMKTFREKKERDYYELLREPNLLEDLGVLVKGEGLELSVVRESLGELVVLRWNRWKPTVLWLRDDADDETIYRNFELLAAAMAGFPPA